VAKTNGDWPAGLKWMKNFQELMNYFFSNKWYNENYPISGSSGLSKDTELR